MSAGLVVEPRRSAAGPRPTAADRTRSNPAVEGQWGTTGPYERLSRLLVEIIRTGLDPEEVGRRAADQFRVPSPSGDVVADISAAMARQGFDPEVRPRRGGAEIVLHNCPFASAALADRQHRLRAPPRHRRRPHRRRRQQPSPSSSPTTLARRIAGCGSESRPTKSRTGERHVDAARQGRHTVTPQEPSTKAARPRASPIFSTRRRASATHRWQYCLRARRRRRSRRRQGVAGGFQGDVVDGGHQWFSGFVPSALTRRLRDRRNLRSAASPALPHGIPCPASGKAGGQAWMLGCCDTQTPAVTPSA